MPEIKRRTKWNGNASESNGKLYFTCHPEDFDKYFDKICEDIFKTHDCKIYYTADMTAEFIEEEKETDLNSTHLFIVPITYKLLTTPNRAMDSDIAYAKEHNIPILPFMMETGIEKFYSAPDKFGGRQFISPFSTDTTEISYAHKLEQFLNSILLTDEVVDNVKKAFDGYIFLSYRKKDRYYANELMKTIHNIPSYRDIAIWYDEFLTLGEDFNKNIDEKLKDSKCFVLLVTPNILEEPDGKPNFVMGYEYPMAIDAQMGILPTEMEQTDKEELISKFKDIPLCVNVNDSASFKEHLDELLKNVTNASNDQDPRHNYLIGLAYLKGIDVEVNRERGLELLALAGEKNYAAAMYVLFNYYYNGASGAYEYDKAIFWLTKLVERCKEDLGETHEDTLQFSSELVFAYSKLHQYEKALQIGVKLYPMLCDKYGANGELPLIMLNQLALIYGYCHYYDQELRLLEYSYMLHVNTFGEQSPNSLRTLNDLSTCYYSLGNYEKALELQQKAFELSCKILGEEHPDTLIMLNNLGATYGHLNDYQKELEIHQKVYKMRQKILGEGNPYTLASLNNIAYVYTQLKDYDNALKFHRQTYLLRCKHLGKRHPETIDSLNFIAHVYVNIGKYKEVLKIRKVVYAVRREILGEEHSETLGVLRGLAIAYGINGDTDKMLEIATNLYDTCCRLYGENSEDARLAKDIMRAASGK